MYIELGHGGHLGFYEGGLVYPNPVTWLDRALVAIVGGIVLSHHDRGLKSGVWIDGSCKELGDFFIVTKQQI